MKKIAGLLLAAVLLAAMLSVFAIPATAAALPEITVEILPDGQDTYSDGTPVLDDETYAIVWTKSPDTEVDFDETFQSDDDMKVLVNAPMAKDGCCPRIQLQLDKSYYQKNSLDTGYFRLFSTNELRRKGNSAMPFEIRETKVTVKNGNNTSPLNSTVVPTDPVNIPAMRLEKIVLVGDWVVMYASGDLDKNQNEPQIMIQPKEGNKGFFKAVTATVLSECNIWIIIAVAVVAVVGVAAVVIVKKKKKTALAGGTDEE